jgi:Putative cyclase
MRTSASGVIICMEHTGTHIDAICHQADGLKLFGDIPVADVQTSRGFNRLAVKEIPPILAPRASRCRGQQGRRSFGV